MGFISSASLWLIPSLQGTKIIAAGITVLTTEAEAPQYAAALARQMEIAQAILDGLGYAGPHLQLLRAGSADELALGLQHAPRGEVPARRAGFNIAADKRQELLGKQDQLMQLIDGKQTLDELAPADQSTAVQTIEWIDALAAKADDERQVCTRERATGTNRPTTVCRSVGDMRRQREQALNRVARAVHRPRLDRLGHRVQGHHHRGLGPLADREGAGHRDGHQRIDVKPAMAQRRQALLVDVEAGEPDRHGRDHEAGGAPGGGLRREVADGLGRDRQQQRRRQRQHSAMGAFMVLVVVVAMGRAPGRTGRGHRLRVEAEPADGPQRGRRRGLVGIEGQQPSAELEPQPANARQPFEGAADLGFFGRAVHRGDAEAVAAQRARRRGIRRGLGAAGPAGTAAVVGEVVVVVVVRVAVGPRIVVAGMGVCHRKEAG